MKKITFIKLIQNSDIEEKNIFYLKIFLLFLIFSSYIYGFYARENIAGGAEADFKNLTWKGILLFKDNFLDTIYNYGKIGEGSLPLFHILNAYLNPFTYSEESFQLSICVISFLNVIIFSQILKQKYKIKIIDSYLYSSIFLILPFFRSSAFWGLTENLGWLFLILTIKFYLVINKNKVNIFLICLFSSLALYTRPYLIFFPIFFLISSYIKKDYSVLKTSVFYYSIFAIPGLILLYIWGGSVYLGTGDDKVNFILEYHQPKFIYENLLIFSSIFLFYFLPFHIVSFSREKKIFKKNIAYYALGFLFLLILHYFNAFDYLNNITLGGGAFLKISQFFFNDNLLFFIVIAFFGIISILYFSEISKKNIVLILSILIIYCTAKNIYQEYFEPLFLIVLFSLFDLKKQNINLLKENKTTLKFLFYFLIYFLSSYYYRYNIMVT